MPKFPEPPSVSELEAIPLRDYIRILPAGTRLWRVYAHGSPYARPWNTFRDFGPLPAMRFDHHELPQRVQQRKILYAASQGPICIAEVFQAQRIIDRFTNEPWLVGFTITRPLTLLDLCGTWPTRAGASMALNSGPHARARRWSQAIYLAYSGIDGLWYSSSMYANEPAVALFERAEGALNGAPFYHAALASPSLFVPLARIARRIGYKMP